MSTDKMDVCITPFGMCSYPALAKPRGGKNDDGTDKTPMHQVVIVFDPVSLGILTKPGDHGADEVVLGDL